MHPFTKLPPFQVQQAMLDEEKWTTPSMTYFRPHFMMPGAPPGTVSEAHDPTNNGVPSASAYAKLQRDHASNPWWLNYDQALDLQSNQQNTMHKPKQIKHEDARYGFDQVNYSGSQPSTVKKTVVEKHEPKYACDQCEYVATQKSSLNRHKMTQHEGIRQPSAAQLSGKTYDCDMCPYQATQLSSLKRHKLAKHSGAQYPCDQCEYNATTPMNLKLHKRSKHEGVRFPCDMCGYEATQPGVLNRHKQQKHGLQPTHEPRNSHNGFQRTVKDPNAPKRPLSGFFHFSQVGRSKVKEANPDFSVADISKELSRRWHALDDVTKAMFEQMAENDKERFQREKSEYMMHPKGGYKQTRAKKDPNAPKRPLCGFMMFSNDERIKVRAVNPNLGVGEIGKELGRRWAVADQECRAKYNKQAEDDKERFLREKAEWQRSPNCFRSQRARKDPNAPKRNVPGFMWFSNEERGKVREDHPGQRLRVGDVAKELSRRWALADPDTKAKYDNMAYQDKQRYEKEKHEWHMKQRQVDMNRPRTFPMDGPGYTVTPKNNTTWQPVQQGQQSGGPSSLNSTPQQTGSLPQSQQHQQVASPSVLPGTHPSASPSPINIGPLALNHHPTPPPSWQ